MVAGTVMQARQVAYALPQEQNQWMINSSTQHPGELQHWVAHALGLDNHAVRVECRRIGAVLATRTAGRASGGSETGIRQPNPVVE